MKHEQKWLAVVVWLAPAAVEAVEYALSEAGASGTEYSTLGIREIREIVSVVGYFDAPPDLRAVESEIKNALEIYNLPADSVVEITAAREVENKDWLAEWKKHWQPTETEKFIVAPAWSDVADTEKIVIRIEPSMAFGTGTHETTRLCLRAIEKFYQPEMSFFDVGTGTGILAIAAAKFKVRSSKFKVVGCDTDFDSIKIARENSRLNEAPDIKFYVGTIDASAPAFDFVAANLTADVIVPLLPLLIEKTEKILLLSGILREQEKWVTDGLKELRMTNYELQADGEWISILVGSGTRQFENS